MKQKPSQQTSKKDQNGGGVGTEASEPFGALSQESRTVQHPCLKKDCEFTLKPVSFDVCFFPSYVQLLSPNQEEYNELELWSCQDRHI